MGREEGLLVEISPFLLGMLTAILPYWWLHALVSALFFGYNALEMWIRLRIGKNGETVAEMLKDVRGFISGYIIGIMARFIGVNL